MRKEQRKAKRRFRKKALRWGIFAAVAIVSLALVLSFVIPSTLRRPAQQQAKTSLRNFPEVQGTPVPVLSGDHVPERQKVTSYISTPPTGGDHWAIHERWGIYDKPIPNEKQVHNLEHGGVLIQYNPQTVDESTIQHLGEIARNVPGFPCYVLVAPYPNMEQKIALTAWGYILNLEAVDEPQIYGFVRAHLNDGPERVACPPY